MKRVIPLLLLLWLVMVGAGAAQDKGLTYVGKIEEVATKTQMTAVGATDRFLTIKLDKHPGTEFRITTQDAANFGLIDTAKPSAVLRPGQVKGMGWKVRLTCDRITAFGRDPVLQVIKLEKLD